MSQDPIPQAHPVLGGDIRFCVVCGAPLERRRWQVDGSSQLCCTREGCNYVHFLDPKVAAGAIVSIEGKAIILRRAHNPGKGLWTFPGGFVDRGEAVGDAAIREVREEAGVIVRLGPLLGVYSFTGMPTVVIVYLAELVEGTPRAAAESTEIRLVGPDEIPFEELAFDTTRAALRDWRTWTATGRIPALDGRGGSDA